MKNEKIEGDILDSIELTGLSQNELESMSNSELKDYQRKESDDEINMLKNRTQFSCVSVLFFLLCAYLVYFNSLQINQSFAIIPMLIVIIFSIRAYVSYEKLELSIISRKMLESFFNKNDL